MEKLKNEKGFSAIVIVIIVVIVAIIVFASSGSKGYELDVISKEALAYAKLRVAEADGALYGFGTIPTEYFDILGSMVKNADSSNQWFASNSGTFYCGEADTSDYQITWISNGTYCAIFYIIKEDVSLTETIYYLVDYSFDVDDVQGYQLFVTD